MLQMLLKARATGLAGSAAGSLWQPPEVIILAGWVQGQMAFGRQLAIAIRWRIRSHSKLGMRGGKTQPVVRRWATGCCEAH
jgi:hypothetical protein